MDDSEITNDALIADPGRTLDLLAEGVGHFLRLALSSYVNAKPETHASIAGLLNAPGQCATLTATLSAGTLLLQIGAHAQGMDAPEPLLSHRVRLPEVRAGAAH